MPTLDGAPVSAANRLGESQVPHEVPLHRHSGLSGWLVVLFGAALLALGVAIASFTSGSDDQGAVSAVDLTPRADLPIITTVEGQHWTHAPAVPPRIERTTQAHLVVDWTATESVGQLDAATGLRYRYWGFEGTTPGPMLRARVGDLIQVNLTNAPGNQQSHNIDFHFATGPGGGAPALSVAPGQSASVEVRALTPGIFMYHCATPDIPTHIANGMYGYVLVEPEEQLPEVDRELYVVQSEFYPANDGTGPATLNLNKVDLEEPDYVVFNGATGSLLGDNSPTANVGDRVRIWFGNAGPQLISSFHVIGEIFDRVYAEGSLTSEPRYGVQTTLVPAGGATAVDLTFDVPGTYLLVDHAIARTLHKGAVGTIIVAGSEDPEIFAAGTDNPPPPPDDGHGGGGTVAGRVSILEGAWDQANAARAFDPATIRIRVGESVGWMNDDVVAHTVTDDAGAFDSGFIDPAASFTQVFSEPGTFTYHCTPHPWMTGTVIVT